MSPASWRRRKSRTVSAVAARDRGGVNAGDVGKARIGIDGKFPVEVRVIQRFTGPGEKLVEDRNVFRRGDHIDSVLACGREPVGTERPPVAYE